MTNGHSFGLGFEVKWLVGRLRGGKTLLTSFQVALQSSWLRFCHLVEMGITQFSFFLLQFFFPSFISRSFVHSSCKDLEDRSESFGITYPAIFFLHTQQYIWRRGLIWSNLTNHNITAVQQNQHCSIEFGIGITVLMDSLQNQYIDISISAKNQLCCIKRRKCNKRA